MRNTYDSLRGRVATATYLVQGHRVEQHHHGVGQSSWSCDCPEHQQPQPRGVEATCKHVQHVAAALTLGRLFGRPELMLAQAGARAQRALELHV